MRDILEALDEVVLDGVADDLRALNGRDGRAAGGTVTATMRPPREHLMAPSPPAPRERSEPVRADTVAVEWLQPRT